MTPLMFSQLPGADEAIKAAEGHGWEAVLVVVLILAVVSGFSYLGKRILDTGEKREARMALRIDALENEIRDKLFEQIKDNSEIMQKMVIAAEKVSVAAEKMLTWLATMDAKLSVRPCLLSVIHQGEFMAQIERFFADKAATEAKQAKGSANTANIDRLTDRPQN